MKAEAIVIQRPERQRRSQRTFLAILTMLAWIVWTILWLPLITLVAWLLGLRTSYIELSLSQHTNGVHDLLMLMLIAVICSLFVLSWSNYNRLRYGHLNRRLARSTVDIQAMATALDVQPATAAELREARSITLNFPEAGPTTHLSDHTLQQANDSLTKS